MQLAVHLGPYQLRNRFALAPMAGLTDVPFRTVAWRMGAGYMVSEMLGSKPQLWDTGKSRSRRQPVAGVTPQAVQIAGTDAAQLAEAARRHVDDGIEVIDLNFGCPVKKVCRKLAGSALLNNPAHVGRLVAAVVDAVDVPVTIKTRYGLTPSDRLGVEAARCAAAAGAAMIVMHGRSRACRFSGQVDYGPIRALTESVDVPVLVNGDIADARDAHAAMAVSGAHGVMIGRAAIGNPWLFRALNGEAEPTLSEKWQLVLEHVTAMHEFYGERDGVRIARKHIQAYARQLVPQANLSRVMRAVSARQQLEWLILQAEDNVARVA